MIPMRVNRLKHLENYLIIINVESYFLQSIYVPYAEHLLLQMSEKFEDQMINRQSLWNLIPKHMGRHLFTAHYTCFRTTFMTKSNVFV